MRPRIHGNLHDLAAMIRRRHRSGCRTDELAAAYSLPTETVCAVLACRSVEGATKVLLVSYGIERDKSMELV